MTHYKISYDVLREAGMKEEASFQTFCGVDLRYGKSAEYHLIGQDNQEPATCPTCVAIYQAIVNHHLDTKGN